MRFDRYPPKVKRNPHRINEEITAKEVRLIDENKTQIGIVPLTRALEIARERELDLVEIAPGSVPPVCRILEYGKFLYSLQKKSHEAQKHQKKVQVKEIKFTPAIGVHDQEVKLRKIREFLADGDKVKVTIWLRGRQKRKPEMLDMMVEKIMGILVEMAEIESPPKREGFFCHIMIGAKKGGKDAKAKNP